MAFILLINSYNLSLIQIWNISSGFWVFTPITMWLLKKKDCKLKASAYSAANWNIISRPSNTRSHALLVYFLGAVWGSYFLMILSKSSGLLCLFVGLCDVSVFHWWKAALSSRTFLVMKMLPVLSIRETWGYWAFEKWLVQVRKWISHFS